MPKSFRSFVLTSGIAVALFLFVGMYFVVARSHEELVREDARRSAGIVAEQTFHSMFQVMRQGWTRDQLVEFLERTRHSFDETPYSVEIYRGRVVEELFGPIEQAYFDLAIEQAFIDGNARVIEDDEGVRFIHPLIARDECLACHANARAGDVLGMIDVHQHIRPVLDQARERFLAAFAPIVPMALVAALGFAWFINRRLGRAIGRLNSNVSRINRVSDLSRVTTENIDLGFTEFNDVLREIDTLVERLKLFAVDKDLLEFEISLLEKFIITSEVVRDWRDYINKLLLEINKVVDTVALFSIFKIEEETLDVEIFWRDNPTPNTRRILEKVVRHILLQSGNFTAPTEVHINHSIANHGAQLPPLSESDIEVQTKSLIVEMPKIGGIVGIGVHSDATSEGTRLLVMESILSTLLNVVGSVKAIYKYTQDLEYYATRDPLTDLFNQRVFWELLENEIGRAKRDDYEFGLLLIDFDNFKAINDTYGHSFGDMCLQRFAAVIRGSLRGPDILARYGGDEFIVILTGNGDEQPVAAAERIRQALAATAIAAPDGGDLRATVSIGLAIYPAHAHAAKDLFMFADNMMYKAKTDGKDRVGIPSAEDVVEVFKRIGEKGVIIKNAIDNRRLIPYFQPLLDVHNGGVEAYEVLSRIELDKDQQPMHADEFIEIAESMGLIHKLDFITIEKAFAHARAIDYRGFLFLNLSPKALVLNEFLNEIKRMVRHYDIDPGHVVFEITERETVKNITVLKAFLGELKADGFRFAIDDFGSGFASFQYIKHFPIDFLKIEGDFISHMVGDRRDYAFVRSISTLARELGIRTVAEHVEDAEILDAVRRCGIDLAQGFHTGRPAKRLRGPAD